LLINEINEKENKIMVLASAKNPEIFENNG